MYLPKANACKKIHAFHSIGREMSIGAQISDLAVVYLTVTLPRGAVTLRFGYLTVRLTRESHVNSSY